MCSSSTYRIMALSLGGLIPPPKIEILAGCFIGLLGALVFLYLRQRSRGDLDKIPGPPPSSWLLGHSTFFSSPYTHKTMLQWSNRYGGVLKFRLAHLPMVFISDPSCLEPLVGWDPVMPKHRALYQHVDEFLGPECSFFTTPVEEEHRCVRKTLAVAFAPDSIKKTYPVLAAKVRLLRDIIRRAAARGEAVDVEDGFNRLVLDYVGEVAFDTRYDSLTDKKADVLEVVKAAFEVVHRRLVDPTRRLWALLCPWMEAFRRERAAVDRALKMYSGIAKSLHEREEPDEGNRSIWARLMKLKHWRTGEALSPSEMQSHMAIMLAAGFETTSHALAWCLFEVACHPQVQAKLHAELRGHGLMGPGARDVTPADLPSLTYLDQVVREGLRMHPSVAMGTIRMASKETRVGPYTVPAGTGLWMGIHAIQNSKHNYVQPERFWPERWEAGGGKDGGGGGRPVGEYGSTMDADAYPFATPAGNVKELGRSWLPFSEGSKNCLGQSMALFTMRLVLAMLLCEFSFELAPQAGGRERVLEGQWIALTLQSKDGIWLTATPFA